MKRTFFGFFTNIYLTKLKIMVATPETTNTKNNPIKNQKANGIMQRKISTSLISDKTDFTIDLLIAISGAIRPIYISSTTIITNEIICKTSQL